MNTTKFYQIKNGPGRDLLFDALKYAYDKDNEIHVRFLVPVGYTAPLGDPGCACVPMKLNKIKLTSIEHEDGSGQSFNLKGFCRAKLAGLSEERDYDFEAYYDTRSRDGWIQFAE